jgi:hypothetical protein
MRSSETVLGMLQDRGKRGVPMQDLYRQLYNPQLYAAQPMLAFTPMMER